MTATEVYSKSGFLHNVPSWRACETVQWANKQRCAASLVSCTMYLLQEHVKQNKQPKNPSASSRGLQEVWLAVLLTTLWDWINYQFSSPQFFSLTLTPGPAAAFLFSIVSIQGIQWPLAFFWKQKSNIVSRSGNELLWNTHKGTSPVHYKSFDEPRTPHASCNTFMPVINQSTSQLSIC